jgi:aldose 1-epimerase
MLAPTGDQLEIRGGGYRAVVTECGAALRLLEHDGRSLVDGFAEDAMPSGGRGQLLVPWPNRVRDGAYSFAGRDLQLPLTDVARGHASHGLVRWVAWSVEERVPHAVSLRYRLMAQSGYPWTLDLQVRYELSEGGLVVTQAARNRSGASAPYAQGAHPYLRVGTGPVDALRLTLPAADRVLTDDRLIPVGREPVAGTAYDFRAGRRIGPTCFDHAFTDLTRDREGRATVELTDPGSGQGVSLWVDGCHGWLQVYSADDVAGSARRSLAVEPMTAPADAFRSGEGLVVLAAAGEPGDGFSAAWGIRAV